MLNHQPNLAANAIRKWVTMSVLLAIFGFIGFIFWYTDWKYSLPTPVPPGYHAVQRNEFINLDGKLAIHANKPVFLHFFNPNCPCSRFNMPQFKLLAATYAGKINFAVVVLTKDKACTAKEIQAKFGLSMPVLFDSSLAAACGVYSTPQAVLLDDTKRLYYRGNYNRNRYCTNENTNYAQMAIAALLANDQQPVFNQYALIAYGCPLPGCKKPPTTQQ